MRRNHGTLNAHLSRVVSELGHTDLLVVSDAGLPIPAGVERVDLAVREGLPSFLDVLDTVLAETQVEAATVPAEIADNSPTMLAALRTRFEQIGVELEMVPHVDFKAQTSRLSSRTS